MVKKRSFSVLMSTDLLAYLAKALPHRTSRFEAFSDLLDEQLKLAEVDFKGGCSVPFLVTILDLSERWDWSRPTVMRYLDSLSKIGAVEVKRCQDGTLIRVLNISQDTP